MDVDFSAVGEEFDARGGGTQREDLIAYGSAGAGAGAGAVCSIYLTPAAAPVCSKIGSAAAEWILENVLATGAGMDVLVADSWARKKGHVAEVVAYAAEAGGVETLRRYLEAQGISLPVPPELAATTAQLAEIARAQKYRETLSGSAAAELNAVRAAGLDEELYFGPWARFDDVSPGDVAPWPPESLEHFAGVAQPRRFLPVLRQYARELAAAAENPMVFAGVQMTPKKRSGGGAGLLLGAALGAALLLARR